VQKPRGQTIPPKYGKRNASQAPRARGKASRSFRRVNGGDGRGKGKFRLAPKFATVLIIAHRGAHTPEVPGVRANTVEAFRAARATADGVELDVRRTADGVLVVVHDPLVDGEPVAARAYAELPGWLPTLTEALEACTGLRYVDVEVKNAPHEPGFDAGTGLAEEVARAARSRTVTSFHLPTVDAVRAAGAERTGWLTLPGYDQLEAVGTVAARGHSVIAPPDAATDERLVSAAHERGLEVVVWTVNDPDRVAQLAGFGVDVCVTDRPALARAALPATRPPA